MPSRLNKSTLPNGFSDFDMTHSEAESIIARIPDVTSKAIMWFEGEYSKADVSARQKKESSMRKMIVSKVKQL